MRLEYLPSAFNKLKDEFPLKYNLINNYFLSGRNLSMSEIAEKYNLNLKKIEYRLKKTKELLKWHVILYENNKLFLCSYTKFYIFWKKLSFSMRKMPNSSVNIQRDRLPNGRLVVRIYTEYSSKIASAETIAKIFRLHGIKKSDKKIKPNLKKPSPTLFLWCRWPDLNRYGCYSEGF